MNASFEVKWYFTSSTFIISVASNKLVDNDLENARYD